MLEVFLLSVSGHARISGWLPTPYDAFQTFDWLAREEKNSSSRSNVGAVSRYPTPTRARLPPSSRSTVSICCTPTLPSHSGTPAVLLRCCCTFFAPQKIRPPRFDDSSGASSRHEKPKPWRASLTLPVLRCGGDLRLSLPRPARKAQGGERGAGEGQRNPHPECWPPGSPPNALPRPSPRKLLRLLRRPP